MSLTKVITDMRKDRLHNLENQLVAISAIAKVMPASAYVQQREQLIAVIGKLKEVSEAGNVFYIEEVRLTRQVLNGEVMKV